MDTKKVMMPIIINFLLQLLMYYSPLALYAHFIYALRDISDLENILYRYGSELISNYYF